MELDLKIPKQILQLVEKGIWPKTQSETQHQNIKSLVPPNKIKEFAPEEDWIYFYSPPFKKVKDDLLVKRGDLLWNQWMAANQINPELALIIADFGLGSDTVLILDYRNDLDTPSVYKLVVNRNGNYWKRVSNDFEEFCEITGLNKFL